MTTKADRYDADEIRELACEYRDTMLRNLGAIGIERAPSGGVPGEKIRDLPVEAPAGFDDRLSSVACNRTLSDVSAVDGGDREVSRTESARYATTRYTTGPAAIFDSTTLTIVWETVPTPREILLAEWLESLSESDLEPDCSSLAAKDVADEIANIVTPPLWRDPLDLWLPCDETAVSNVTAVEDCVSGVRLSPDHDQLCRIFVERQTGTDDAAPFARWSLEISGHDLVAVESWSTEGWGNRETFAYQKDMDADVWEDITHRSKVEGMGYLRSWPASDDDTSIIDTGVFVIPELEHPARVFDLPRRSPTTPFDEGAIPEGADVGGR